MTDYDRIKAYYSVFDEQHRLDNPEGQLEFQISLGILFEYLKKTDDILDLGGGAGKYAIELAKLGYKVTLADLSQRLLDQARSYISENSLPPLQSIDTVNAVDLGRYKSASFDSVILFGPLYHLLEETERRQCISEVCRILKPGGIVLASFIPYLSGASGIITRALYCPDQVGEINLSQVFDTGKFTNNSMFGFQEGYYPNSGEIEGLFSESGFHKILLRSIRGLGSGKEEGLYELKNTDQTLFNAIIHSINKTAANPAVIETCGHALYIGKKLPPA